MINQPQPNFNCKTYHFLRLLWNCDW